MTTKPYTFPLESDGMRNLNITIRKHKERRKRVLNRRNMVAVLPFLQPQNDSHLSF
jgi:hypothetical protein